MRTPSEDLPAIRALKAQDRRERNRQLLLSGIVGSLCRQGSPGLGAWHRTCREPLPSREVILQVVQDLKSVLFPGFYGPEGMCGSGVSFHVGAVLDRAADALNTQIQRCLCFSCDQEHDCNQCRRWAEDVVDSFLAQLPQVQEFLWEDVEAHFHGDPAAKSRDEVVFCYPGMTALIHYRLAHELYELGVPLLPRIVTEAAHSLTGIDIHPGAKIGRMFFMDHGTGIVIGETCEIGNRVRIYQGVTLGAKSFPVDEHGNPMKGVPRHPIVEDDVIIYSGATILGRVTVGRGSVIGGNVWLTKSVPPGTKVLQAQSREEVFEHGSGI